MKLLSRKDRETLLQSLACSIEREQRAIQQLITSPRECDSRSLRERQKLLAMYEELRKRIVATPDAE